jgi:hypothetical protein
MTPLGVKLAWVGGLAAGALALGGVVYAATKAPAATSGPGTTNALQLVPGHRYRVVVVDPAIAQLPGAASLTMNNAQTGFDAGFGQGIFQVVATTVSGSTWTMLFDYRGAQAFAMPGSAFQFSPTTTRSTITDLGPSPTMRPQ